MPGMERIKEFVGERKGLFISRRLRFSSMPTLFGTGLVLLALVIAGETGARSQLASRFLPAPSIGSGLVNLDLKFIELERFSREQGPVDCIFLGNSLVHRGIDPRVFDRVYGQLTGRKLSSFNFGVAGLAPEGARLVARVLIGLYHPKLLVLGTTVNDYRDGFGVRTSTLIADNPWIRYQLGHFSLAGWLAEESAAYRFFLRFLIWLEEPELSRRISRQESEMTTAGFGPENRSQNIDENRGSRRLQQQYRKWEHFRFGRGELSNLVDIMGAASSTEFILLEMPVHHSCFQFLKDKVHGYLMAREEIQNLAANSGEPFVELETTRLIPDDGWADLHHMNAKGADRFSRWLAGQVAREFPDGF